MNIFIGNLNYAVSEDEVRELFEGYGQVDSVKIIKDRETGRAKGFGFIEMEDENEARNAIQELDGYDFSGRPLRVNEARPSKPRPRY